ncbi:MAG: hypothetical protein ACI83O_000631 [Patescibacteria group bacterium]|jgi:hypothetical protein
MSVGGIIMDKGKIEWCIKQSKGIRPVDSNEAISKEYRDEAMQDLEAVSMTNKKWRSIAGYYSCYDMLYAILMKCGIKCEIHDCSLSLMPMLGFNEEYVDYITLLKRERIDVQYYLKEPKNDVSAEKVSWFLDKRQEILLDMNDSVIAQIRKEIQEVMI